MSVGFFKYAFLYLRFRKSNIRLPACPVLAVLDKIKHSTMDAFMNEVRVTMEDMKKALRQLVDMMEGMEERLEESIDGVRNQVFELEEKIDGLGKPDFPDDSD